MYKKMKNAGDLDLQTPQQVELTKQLGDYSKKAIFVCQGVKIVLEASEVLQKLPIHVWQRMAYEADKFDPSSGKGFGAASLLVFANLMVEMCNLTANMAMDEQLCQEMTEEYGPAIRQMIDLIRNEIDK
jgi:hypothetical protein